MRDIGYHELAGCETNGGNPHIQDTWQHLWRKWTRANSSPRFGATRKIGDRRVDAKGIQRTGLDNGMPSRRLDQRMFRPGQKSCATHALIS